eukprot:TRINITY_DN50086_c0_g1_i1.p1 TRINITY_DN50086_c0_g1~~TRINITY_DN50086_c0_g1_i1.p1  ORF type:complete len:347 (+),score=41.05 TRINITY_DN50086_c0_g1_i1:89-1129(+)
MAQPGGLAGGALQLPVGVPIHSAQSGYGISGRGFTPGLAYGQYPAQAAAAGLGTFYGPWYANMHLFTVHNQIQPQVAGPNYRGRGKGKGKGKGKDNQIQHVPSRLSAAAQPWEPPQRPPGPVPPQAPQRADENTDGEAHAAADRDSHSADPPTDPDPLPASPVIAPGEQMPQPGVLLAPLRRERAQSPSRQASAGPSGPAPRSPGGFASPTGSGGSGWSRAAPLLGPQTPGTPAAASPAPQPRSRSAPPTILGPLPGDGVPQCFRTRESDTEWFQRVVDRAVGAAMERQAPTVTAAVDAAVGAAVAPLTTQISALAQAVAQRDGVNRRGDQRPPEAPQDSADYPDA